MAFQTRSVVYATDVQQAQQNIRRLEDFIECCELAAAELEVTA